MNMGTTKDHSGAISQRLVVVVYCACLFVCYPANDKNYNLLRSKIDRQIEFSSGGYSSEAARYYNLSFKLFTARYG